MTLVVRTPLAWLGPGRITPDVQITCEGDTITEVGPVRPVPDEARVIAIEGFCMPAGADRHVHAELGDTVVDAAAGRDGRARPRVATRPHLPARGGVGAAGVPRPPDPGGRADAHRARRATRRRRTWAPAGTGLEVADADEAAGAVAALGQRGATAIKVSLNAQAGTHAERRRADGRV